uniref:Uncharacterized protein n=1 Tax=Glossina austeni TaxID=7395 RepID=A0A1A9UCX8_GLOAU
MTFELKWLNVSWDWNQFCVTGLRPFGSGSNDLLPCFQEIVLQFPAYTLFAAISAYNFGIYNRCVARNRTQLMAINIRAVLSLLLALLAGIKLEEFYRLGSTLYASDILVACSEVLAIAKICRVCMVRNCNCDGEPQI